MCCDLPQQGQTTSREPTAPPLRRRFFMICACGGVGRFDTSSLSQQVCSFYGWCRCSWVPSRTRSSC